ncbi:hypothetical protein CLIB1444_04S06810 [[Candida] jaroonii]|uniref:Uncharacterized protein n=1 Tax=[Candida] jaroonii TaxID=467808 RepID=A0ACA9Y7J7_9ASCO|nr:hypothetical protein CLIB1444_04S06810 [[Candida] jaroonii]
MLRFGSQTEDQGQAQEPHTQEPQAQEPQTQGLQGQAQGLQGQAQGKQAQGQEVQGQGSQGKEQTQKHIPFLRIPSTPSTPVPNPPLSALEKPVKKRRNFI